MSGVELTEAERADLLRAWPWPVGAATTTTGFADVVATAERIKARARVEGAREALEAAADAAEGMFDPPAAECAEWAAWLRARAASAADLGDQGEEGRP